MMYETQPQAKAPELAQEVGEEAAAALGRYALAAFEHEDWVRPNEHDARRSSITLSGKDDQTPLRLIRIATEQGTQVVLSVGPIAKKGVATRTVYYDSPDNIMPFLPASGEIPKPVLEYAQQKIEQIATEPDE